MQIDPTLRELAQAAEFLSKRYGTMATPQDVQDLCFLLQEMRLKERRYVVDYLQREEDEYGNAVCDGSLVDAGDAIANGSHLP